MSDGSFPVTILRRFSTTFAPQETIGSRPLFLRLRAKRSKPSRLWTRRRLITIVVHATCQVTWRPDKNDEFFIQLVSILFGRKIKIAVWHRSKVRGAAWKINERWWKYGALCIWHTAAAAAAVENERGGPDSVPRPTNHHRPGDSNWRPGRSAAANRRAGRWCQSLFSARLYNRRWDRLTSFSYRPTVALSSPDTHTVVDVALLTPLLSVCVVCTCGLSFFEFISSCHVRPAVSFLSIFFQIFSASFLKSVLFPEKCLKTERKCCHYQ